LLSFDNEFDALPLLNQLIHCFSSSSSSTTTRPKVINDCCKRHVNLSLVFAPICNWSGCPGKKINIKLLTMVVEEETFPFFCSNALWGKQLWQVLIYHSELNYHIFYWYKRKSKSKSTKKVLQKNVPEKCMSINIKDKTASPFFPIWLSFWQL